MSRRTAFRCWRWDGRAVVPHRGGVSLTDRGFRYGQHLFESLAVRDGVVLLGREHLSLLTAAAARNDFPFPRALATALRSFLSSAKLQDGMLRIYLTAGAGAPGAPVTDPGCFLSWEETRFPMLRDLERGFRLVTVSEEASGDWGEKSGNYLPHLAALTAARRAGGDEAVVSDVKGRVISCAMGNLLVWLPSRSEPLLCTPAPGARTGAVLGWVRRYLPVKERPHRLPDLRRAVALAVTNSRLGVMPVASLDGNALPDTAPARELAMHYLRAHGLLGSA